MTKKASSPKITLSKSRDIPFNRLRLSQANVRQVQAGLSIEELAEDIARHSLLQGLNVRAVLDEAGAPTGDYEVPAGGRRFRALELLVNQKRLSATALIPCILREEGMAEEDSLTENIQRVALHPLDQFRAFKALYDKGVREEDIAERFQTSLRLVKQRLKLAGIAPSLLTLYEREEIRLEQLMALTLSDDQARQEQVWAQASQNHATSAYALKALLSEGSISLSNPRVAFIGIEALEAAGGVICRDLFSDGDNQGYCTDPALVERLVAAKLKTMADELAKTEPWQWVAVRPQLGWQELRGYHRLYGTVLPLTPEDIAAKDQLNRDYDALRDHYDGDDDMPEDISARLDALADKINSFDREPVFSDEDYATAGAIIALNPNGRVDIHRGLIEPQQATSSSDAAMPETDKVSTKGNPARGSVAVKAETKIVTLQNEDDDEGADDTLKPLPERLLNELSAARTLALRLAVASNAEVAMTVLLHRLVLDVFYHDGANHCLDVYLRPVSLASQPEHIKHSSIDAAFQRHHETWKAAIPRHPEGLWNWLSELDEDARRRLLAHGVALGINALYDRSSDYGRNANAIKLATSNEVARAVNLDMVAASWQPRVENYLGRIPKPRILDAVREARGEATAQMIAHLKKGDMAREAERFLENSGWLPEPLRASWADDALLKGAAVPQAEEIAPAQYLAAAADADALPDFLAGEADADDADYGVSDEANDDSEAHLPHAIAAE